MKSKLYLGSSLLILGVLLLAAALMLGIFNISDELTAEKESRQAADMLFQQMTEEHHGKNSISDSDPLAVYDDAVIEIDGRKYVGILTIPKLSLELPVLNELSKAGLKMAPCLYSGSVKNNDLVIGAHNYASHFGNLYTLSIGDEVYFTEVDGSVTRYLVADKETLMPGDADILRESEYDLTLFTCTVGGRRRVTVRCEKAAE